MGKRVWLAVLVAMLAAAPVSGCRAQGKAAMTVDTTKDVYGDDEAPAFQINVVNGAEERIPWDRVPEAQRWLVAWKQNSDEFEHRVPIVRVEISSRDREGRPVPPKDGYSVNVVEYGLNPKYFKHTYAGKAH